MWITQGTLMGNPWGIADIKGYVNMAHFDRRLEGSWLQLRERRLAIQVQYVHNSHMNLCIIKADLLVSGIPRHR